MGTTENLRAAFAGESEANRRYLAFAKKAEEEGLKNVARLFRAAAEAETIHAHNHIKADGGIRTTKEFFSNMILAMKASGKRLQECRERKNSTIKTVKI